jgi:hypothetical protein
MPRASLRALLGLSVLLLASTGCSRFREIGACRALAREVNPLLEQIEALSKKPGAEPQAQMAKHYAELGKRLKPRGAGKGALATAIREYATVFEATSTALRNLSETTRTGTSGRVNEPRRELERLVKRERAVVARIEAECHG